MIKCVGFFFHQISLYDNIENVLFGNSVYRQFYKSTLDSFPGAYMLFGAMFCILAAILNSYLYTQRHRMRCSDAKEQEQTPAENYIKDNKKYLDEANREMAIH